MKSFIKKLQKKFCKEEVKCIEAELIYYYIKKKHLDVEQSKIITQYMLKNKSDNVQLEIYILENAPIKEIDQLIIAFELLISSEDKKNNGMVYTPVNIKEYIVQNVITSKEIPKVVDPACGCGSFLITAARWMHKKYKLLYSEIFE